MVPSWCVVGVGHKSAIVLEPLCTALHVCVLQFTDGAGACFDFSVHFLYSLRGVSFYKNVGDGCW